MLGRQKEAFDVDVEHAIPLVLAELDRPAGRADANIIVQYVDAAPPGHAGIDHGLDAAVLRGIGLEGHRLAAFVCDQAHGLLGRGALAVDAEHARTLAREGDGRAFAIAITRADRARADHDRHLVLQSARHVLPALLSYRGKVM
jgi:hypothetical protein